MVALGFSVAALREVSLAVPEALGPEASIHGLNKASLQGENRAAHKGKIGPKIGLYIGLYIGPYIVP